jgi:hypothetical protein
MVKTTIYLEEATAARLKRRAQETGRSQADIVREAVDSATRPRVSPHWGKFKSGDPDLSNRVEEILEDTARSGELM